MASAGFTAAHWQTVHVVVYSTFRTFGWSCKANENGSKQASRRQREKRLELFPYFFFQEEEEKPHLSGSVVAWRHGRLAFNDWRIARCRGRYDRGDPVSALTLDLRYSLIFLHPQVALLSRVVKFSNPTAVVA